MIARGPAGEWHGHSEDVAFEPAQMKAVLRDLEQPCCAIRLGDRLGLAVEGRLCADQSGLPADAELAGMSRGLLPSDLGDATFQADHGVRLSYSAGSMANGIASEALVQALAQEGLFGSFGAAGLLPDRIAQAIRRLRSALPGTNVAFNLIHNPSEDALERRTVEVYLDHQVTTIEASAYIDLTPHVVRYRVAGLLRRPDGRVEARNRVVAKVSRREVATRFLQSPPAELVQALAGEGLISSEQAALAAHVSMCDDLTIEADSGGHTDNRPLVCLLPSMIELRDEIQAARGFEQAIRVGAAGGISTPGSALAALTMGAAYVVTGSVNQSCREAGTSDHTKRLLAQAGMADVMMAPAADMFEMGVKVQLLKKGTLFPMRAQRLYELYQAYDSLEALPEAERERLERQVFRRALGDVWQDTETYFRERDPEQLELALGNPKRKMALVFRWYLGLSSRWSNGGEPGREMDYQIWCGPSMGAFNDWVRGSYLESPEARSVVDVAWHIMRGAAYLHRLNDLQLQGVRLPAEVRRYIPEPLAG